ncbi:DUF5325 family protein [Metabacillus endolithicus]|uniref:DUF5325 family protein n=1 Tax=Metabacillus endolithicus TaxID=1535204 RepID=UPI001FF89924|nr:DUF5325 family protein [Metabacillus endolithicus]UPG63136.1 YlaF family protein [Metabacillus endolithicus]
MDFSCISCISNYSFMIGIGVAVGERSILGIILAIIGLNAVMATGFIMKKRMREKGLI